MAKHSSKKRRGNFRAIKFNTQVALATLADEIIVKVNLFPNNSTMQTYCISVDSNIAVRDNTAGEGPIEVGYAHGDYDVTEIKEATEAGASFDPGNKVSQEHNRRLVRMAGQLPMQAVDEVLNDGRPKRTKLGFMVSQGFNLAFYVKNKSGAALTTGAIVECYGTLYVRQT